MFSLINYLFFYFLIIVVNGQEGPEEIPTELEEPILEESVMDEQFQCNFCVHSRKKKDVLDDVNQNPDCMNKLKFQSRLDLRRICASNEKYCMSTVTNLNGFFVLVERDCAEDCQEGCEERGYGLFYTECTRCCQDMLCNEWDGKQYYMPNLSCVSCSGLVILSLVMFVKEMIEI